MTQVPRILELEFEKLRAEIFFVLVEKTQIMLKEQGKLLIEPFRPLIYNFFVKFLEWLYIIIFLAPHQNTNISAK